jgi:uncharacterized protein HemY
MIPKRFKRILGKEKTKEELDEHYKNIELEKGDFAAMVIAALITFLPVLIIAMTVIYGLLWLFFLR